MLTSLRNGNDTSRIALFNALAWEYRKSYPDSTIYYSEEAKALIEKIHLNNHNVAQQYNYTGMAYGYKGNCVKAYDYYILASKEALYHHDSVQYGHSLNNLGRWFMNQGDFEKSYDYFFLAKEMFEKIGDDAGTGYCYKSLSALYQTQNNFTKALQMSEQAYLIRKESYNIPGQISTLIDIALIHQQTEEYPRAFEYYMAARVLAESIDDAINLANINIGVANLYFIEEEYESALNFAIKAESSAAGSSGNVDINTRINLLFGKIYFAQHRWQKAKSYFAVVLEKLGKSHSLSIEKDTYYYLSVICKMQGDFICAYENHIAFNETENALNSAETARNIQLMESRMEIESRTRENEILRANQIRDKALIDRQKSYTIALLLAIVAGLVIVVNLYILGRKRRKANRFLLEKNKEIAAQREEIAGQNEKINSQNKKLITQNKELITLNSEKDNLMNIVAHDLKSPLTRLKSLTVLMECTPLNEEQKDFISMQKHVSQSGLNIIRNLLEINAFEDNTNKTQFSQVNLSNLLQDQFKAFESDARAKDITFRMEDNMSDTFYYCDPVYLSRILDNLISNAIKFSYPGKEVLIRGECGQEGFSFAVKDFGQGFSEKDKLNLYKKFQKLSAQPTSGESSSGLGLAIVKGLVDKLGGEIFLTTELSKGSEFVIKFPFHQQAQRQNMVS